MPNTTPVLKKQLLSGLKSICGPNEAENILKDIEIKQTENAILLRFPHVFSLDLFKNKYVQELSKNIDSRIILRVKKKSEKNNIRSSFQRQRQELPYGHNYTFDNFLHNKKNYFPWISSKEIAEKNNTEFNPFVIFGTNSTGKTHLLRAIANHILTTHQVNPQKLFLTNLEKLQNIYKHEFENWTNAREFIANKKFLFIDDLHLLLRHENLQKELILLFDHFHEEKKQMIFSFTGGLSILDNINPNLKSRLEWGLIVRLKKPDMDVRIRYIKQKCKEKKLKMSNEQILTIAERFKNIRTIQGIILKLFAFHKLVTPDLSTDDFQSILSSLDNNNHERNISFEELVQIVCEETNVSPQDILSQSRKQNIVRARHICMYLARQFLPLSYPEIGKKFGNRDHSTIMYSVKKIEKLKKDNQEMKNLLKNMIAKCHLLVQE